MKSFYLVLCCGLLLTACDELNPLRITAASLDNGFAASAEGIHISSRMKNATDWTQRFKILYPAMVHCLEAHPAPPAWATRVTPLGGGRIKVRMQGAGGHTLDCLIEQNAVTPLSLTEAYGLDFSQPAFFPVAYGKPEAHECLAVEAVEKGWFFETVGWLARHRCTPPWQAGEEQVIYDLDRKGGPVVEKALHGLPEAGIEILAFVTARMNTSCDNGQCALTAALGLGKQCGDRHTGAVTMGFNDTAAARCAYVPDGATRNIWANRLVLKHVGDRKWQVTGNITRADDRGQTNQPLREVYQVGDAGEIVVESSSFDDWNSDQS